MTVPGSSETRNAWCDAASWRQTADRPTRRVITAVSPVSSTSMRRIGLATRMSSSLVTVVPLPMMIRGPSRKPAPERSTKPNPASVRR